jgi:hypothetical protein
VPDAEISAGYRRILESLEKESGDVISQAVHTWMIIYDKSRVHHVEEMVKLFLPHHILQREASYIFARGEPCHSNREPVRVMYV